ncbi:hypothetical protein ONS95_000487 [Cadophora gregata]|uniref:uncharacterized protein n=1 Tax=Cadophora gregata TaxID=51156 RepID=UPI0026DD4121|nr:uncharacterized protein ONS95_000487 [Cadophora gregata]KAK0128518.1 hypothetical protein ONS95_000487 [Cadophora gregata]
MIPQNFPISSTLLFISSLWTPPVQPPPSAYTLTNFPRTVTQIESDRIIPHHTFPTEHLSLSFSSLSLPSSHSTSAHTTTPQHEKPHSTPPLHPSDTYLF